MHLISEMDSQMLPMNGIKDDLEDYDPYYSKIVGKAKEEKKLGKIVCKQLDMYHKYNKLGQIQKNKHMH